jgi:putative ABC transport system permease protein
MVRWSWRLFRREWRQQVLVLGLLAIAVAVTTVGLALATEAPTTPAATFGRASDLLTISPGPQLSADLAAARRWFGTIDVTEHQTAAIPGTLGRIDVRDQNPRGAYGYPMLRLDAGHYPAGAGQVAMTAGIAATYGVKIGSIWPDGGRALRVTGLVENPQNLGDEFALVAPGQASPPAQVMILVDASAARVAAFRLPGGGAVRIEQRTSQPSNADAVLVFAAIGFLFIGLVAVAGFTVMAQRRLRALGMLGAVGATDRHVRLVMLANGAVIGAVAAVTGAVIGVAGWIAFLPRLQTLAGHRIGAFSLPWLEIAAAMMLAVLTAVGAAWWPARTAARIPIVAALSGRPPHPQPGHRFAALGGGLLAAGLACIAVSRRGSADLLVIAGLVLTAVGVLLLGPLAIRALAGAGQRAPVAVRLALRDLARYQARSGAALGAISLVIGIAAAIAISASQEVSKAQPEVSGHPANQLIAYVSPGGAVGPLTVPSAARIAAMRAGVQDLAASLHTGNVIALEAAINPAATIPASGRVPAGPGGGHARGGSAPNGQQAGFSPASGNPVAMLAVVTRGPRGGTIFQLAHQLYVATPALLAHYGIKTSAVNRAADALAAPHLRLAGLQLSSGLRTVIAQPVIQTISGLPGSPGDPSALITGHAITKLGLRAVRAGWLIQTARPLTAAQFIAASHQAAAAGLTLDRSFPVNSPSLSSFSVKATAVGILAALVVLAMTVGLIRSETASDLRVLTAAGAGSGARRTLTGATAGALALLGALLGTAGAYLASAAWDRSARKLVSLPTLSLRVSLAVILIGLPLLAAAAGWLLAGREPAGVARQPME